MIAGLTIVPAGSRCPPTAAGRDSLRLTSVTTGRTRSVSATTASRYPSSPSRAARCAAQPGHDGRLHRVHRKASPMVQEPVEAGDPLGRLRQAWGAMVEMFASMRPLLVAFVEAMTQAEHSQELRAQLSLGYERLRNTIAETVIAMAPELPQDQARDVASFLIAVNDGLMVQWLLDPERSLDGERAFDAAKMIFGA